jgi:hypothetical protein
LVKYLKGKRQLRRARSRCKDNIKMGINEKEWEGVNWIHLAQDKDQWHALFNKVTTLRAP